MLSRWTRWIARTPLHPQWLLGRRAVPAGLAQLSGVLLDVGAADRWVESHLAQGVHYVALDYPPTGQKLYGARPHVFGDGARLPFRDACFDAVTCLEVLEHVPDPGLVMSEIARVLRPGGHAWISMPFLYPLHDAPFDFQRHTEFGLRRDVQRAGLQVRCLCRSGHAVRSAGLLMSLAIAGGAYASAEWWRWPLLLLASPMVLVVNVAAWLFSLIWPDWSHMSVGHALEVTKP